MVTFVTVLALSGFFLLYNTSKKVALSRSLFIERWAQDNILAGKYSGLLLLIIDLVVSMLYFGIGSGTFVFFVILMTVASLVVIVAPLEYVTYKSLLIFCVFSFALELILK